MIENFEISINRQRIKQVFKNTSILVLLWMIVCLGETMYTML